MTDSFEMFRGKRVKKSVRSQALRFHNPFMTNGLKSYLKIYENPINRDDMNYNEFEESQTTPVPMVKDNLGIDMKKMTRNVIALPSGVTSLENKDKSESAQRKIHRFNAGILTDKQIKMKALAKYAKKRQEDKLSEKVYQWLAETDEQDNIPIELKEGFAKFIADPKNSQWRQRHEARKRAYNSPEREEQRAREKREQLNKYLRQNPGLHEWERNLLTQVTINPQFISENEMNQPMPENYEPENIPMNQNIPGYSGLVQPIGSGWRTARLYKRVQPLKPFELNQTPEEILKKKQEFLDEMRNSYKEEQKERRGKLPSNDMVQRAFPKTASPLINLSKPLSSDFLIIPDPNFFPKHKFSVKSMNL